jgi:hypothetical protein
MLYPRSVVPIGLFGFLLSISGYSMMFSFLFFGSFSFAVCWVLPFLPFSVVNLEDWKAANLAPKRMVSYHFPWLVYSTPKCDSTTFHTWLNPRWGFWESFILQHTWSPSGESSNESGVGFTHSTPNSHKYSSWESLILYGSVYSWFSFSSC